MSVRIGALEELILLAVGGLDTEAYAVPVQQRIEEASVRTPTMGAIYTSLERLEEKGFLKSELGDVTPQPGGRRKRYYRLTGSGAVALSDTRQAREKLWAGLQLGAAGGTS
ncbi:MAG: PadR family transcriptional regulator [Bacteroidetes bacterium]|nr:PadR family transcriptional regulator [Bacteroidota bacterium]